MHPRSTPLWCAACQAYQPDCKQLQGVFATGEGRIGNPQLHHWAGGAYTHIGSQWAPGTLLQTVKMAETHLASGGQGTVSILQAEGIALARKHIPPHLARAAYMERAVVRVACARCHRPSGASSPTSAGRGNGTVTRAPRSHSAVAASKCEPRQINRLVLRAGRDGSA